MITPLVLFAAVVFLMFASLVRSRKDRTLASLSRAQEAWAEAQDRTGLTP